MLLTPQTDRWGKTSQVDGCENFCAVWRRDTEGAITFSASLLSPLYTNLQQVGHLFSLSTYATRAAVKSGIESSSLSLYYG